MRYINDGGRYHIETSPLICSAKFSNKYSIIVGWGFGLASHSSAFTIQKICLFQTTSSLTFRQLQKENLLQYMYHCTKNEIFHYGFPQQIWPSPQETRALVTFTEISSVIFFLNGKLHFLCSVCDMANINNSLYRFLLF